ncbi:glycoside hydrolase family 2 TIM barrel-domain containing protein [Dokdonia pacifica]|nr:glycoside hydrolase family 2 TIM barrel-domain containing protein [Dokdonia pacifica]
MVKMNRNILRSILIISYMIIIAVIIGGISSLYSYLNTGADRATILHTEIQKIDQYIPDVYWAPLYNEGRPMDQETLERIENNYLDAWYVKQIAYKTNTTSGIEDYYTENARKNLYNTIAHNTEEGIVVEATTLEHHPTLEFFSEDGQLVVITDYDVVEYKRLYKDEVLILETTETATYKIVLLLEDGFWRIRHMVKEHQEVYTEKERFDTLKDISVKGINYYPQATPWDMFGDGFDPEILSKDFQIIKDAGLESIRIFVQYDDFGKANVQEDKLQKLKQTLDLAERHNLKVMVTLFDFYGDYAVLDWTLNRRHAATIVSSLKEHPALYAWDIKNEPNLDFESRGEKQVTAWLQMMTSFVKNTDPDHPVTIGWSNAESAIILKDHVDFVSFHFYEDLDTLEDVYLYLNEEIPTKPIVLSEFGMSSYKGIWNPFGNSENDQATYHKEIQGIIAKHKIPSMSWTLYDFVEIPKEVVGRLPWQKNNQKQFGFINQKGDEKAAFKYIFKE